MSQLVTEEELKKSGYNTLTIFRQIHKNKLGNLGFGIYTKKPNIFHIDNDEIANKIRRLLDNYPIKPNQVVFSSMSLNFCINQLISGATYIVEIEKEYIESAFQTIKESLDNVVLLKPNNNDKINYWKPNAIYIEELFKRSPINNDGTITIEKLIVDLLFDERIYSLYSGQDIDLAIEVLCSKYTINYKTLFAYATRKGRRNQLLEKIEKYIPDLVLEKIKNDQ